MVDAFFKKIIASNLDRVAEVLICLIFASDVSGRLRYIKIIVRCVIAKIETLTCPVRS